MRIIARLLFLIGLATVPILSMGCHNDKNINEKHDKALEEEGEE